MPFPLHMYGSMPCKQQSDILSVWVAFIRLGGVKLLFSTVSPNLTNFLVLPNPTPYSESESLSLYQHFCPFLPDFFNAFLGFLIFLVSCAQVWLSGFAFLPLFLAAWKLVFSFPSFSNLQQSWVLCMVYAPPCFLHRLLCFSKQTFLGTLAVDLVSGCYLSFLPLWEAFLEDSGFAFS